jgi:hypothetical protein
MVVPRWIECSINVESYSINTRPTLTIHSNYQINCTIAFEGKNTPIHKILTGRWQKEDDWISAGVPGEIQYACADCSRVQQNP